EPVPVGEPAAVAPPGVPGLSQSRPTRRWTLGLPASLVWLTGASVLGLRRGIQQLLLARRIRSWRRPRDLEVESLLAACCRRLKIRSRIFVMTSDDDSGPAVTGLLHP